MSSKINKVSIRTTLIDFRENFNTDSWKGYSKGNFVNAIIFGGMMPLFYSFILYVTLANERGNTIEKIAIFAVFSSFFSILICGAFWVVGEYCITSNALRKIKKLKNNYEYNQNIIKKIERHMRSWIFSGFVFYTFFIILFSYIVVACFGLSRSTISCFATILLVFLCQLKAIGGVLSLNWNVIAKRNLIEIDGEQKVWLRMNKFQCFVFHCAMYVLEVGYILVVLTICTFFLGWKMNDLCITISIVELLPILTPLFTFIFFYFKTAYFHFFSKQSESHNAYLTIRDFLDVRQSADEKYSIQECSCKK